MEAKVEKQPKNTYKLTVSHSPDEILKAKSDVLQSAAEKTEIKGFRKGKAPIDLVEEQLDKNFLHREVLNALVNQAYPQLVSEHKLSPLTPPRVNIITWKPFSDLNYELSIAEKPEVHVGDYKKEIEKRAEKIKKNNSQAEILEAILATTEAEISDVLIDTETERMLSRLVDQVGQIGLTIDKYLQTKNQTLDQLREEYMKGAEKTLKAELAFAEVISVENISVSDDEVDKAIKANPDEASRSELMKKENRWYIESVLLRQKLLDKLLEYAEKHAKV